MKSLEKRKGLANYLRSHQYQNGIIVCEQPKFIYMKAAKTAGTSILRMELEKKISGIFHKKDNPVKFEKWINEITDKDLEEYYIFSVVRNPWDRIASVSTYFNIPFDDFIVNIDSFWKDENIKMHSLPIHYYTHNNGVQFVDMICRFECLQPDINLVFDRLNIERKELSFVNQSKKHGYSSYYNTNNQIEKVASIYEKDIEYYGYMFQDNIVRQESFISKIYYVLSRIKRRLIS